MKLKIFCFILLLFLFSTAYGYNCKGIYSPTVEFVENTNKMGLNEILINEIQHKYPVKHMSRMAQAGLYGLKDVVEFIWDNNKDEFYLNATETLYAAAETGQVVIVELLLLKGINVNVRLKSGLTAIYPAVHNGYCDLVDLLIAKGADTTHKVDGYADLLMLAKLNKHEKIIRAVEERNKRILEERKIKKVDDKF